MRISKSSEMKKVIYEILADNKEHTVIEIKEKGKKINSDLDWDTDLCNTVLYQMKLKDAFLINAPKGVYKLLKESADMGETEDFLIELSELCTRFERKISKKNYLELDESEYLKDKNQYNICKEIKSIIDKHMLNYNSAPE